MFPTDVARRSYEPLQDRVSWGWSVKGNLGAERWDSGLHRPCPHYKWGRWFACEREGGAPYFGVCGSTNGEDLESFTSRLEQWSFYLSSIQEWWLTRLYYDLEFKSIFLGWTVFVILLKFFFSFGRHVWSKSLLEIIRS